MEKLGKQSANGKIRKTEKDVTADQKTEVTISQASRSNSIPAFLRTKTD